MGGSCCGHGRASSRILFQYSLPGDRNLCGWGKDSGSALSYRTRDALGMGSQFTRARLPHESLVIGAPAALRWGWPRRRLIVAVGLAAGALVVADRLLSLLHTNSLSGRWETP